MLLFDRNSKSLSGTSNVIAIYRGNFQSIINYIALERTAAPLVLCFSAWTVVISNITEYIGRQKFELDDTVERCESYPQVPDPYKEQMF